MAHEAMGSGPELPEGYTKLTEIPAEDPEQVKARDQVEKEFMRPVERDLEYALPEAEIEESEAA